MSNEFGMIDLSMNEFGVSLSELDKTCNILYNLAEEIIHDFKNGTFIFILLIKF